MPRASEFCGVPELDRKQMTRPNGEKVWHDLVPTRFATATPTAAKGPIRARAYRADKEPDVPVLDSVGSPQLRGKV